MVSIVIGVILALGGLGGMIFMVIRKYGNNFAYAYAVLLIVVLVGCVMAAGGGDALVYFINH